MNRWVRSVAGTAAVVLLAVAAAGQTAPQAMSVQIRNGQIRSTASYLGKPVAPVAYGDRVSIITKAGEWYEVKAASGATGWLHQSALTPKKIVLKANAAEVSSTASGEELALAGKGFNAQVEADFKKKNPETDFARIDRMEQIRVSPQESADFLREGQVAP